MLEKVRKEGSPLNTPLLKITRNVIYEDLHVREKAVVVIDLGRHCPRHESIFLTFLVRRLHSLVTFLVGCLPHLVTMLTAEGSSREDPVPGNAS